MKWKAIPLGLTLGTIWGATVFWLPSGFGLNEEAIP